MKALLVFIFSLPLGATTYELNRPDARFLLKISAEEVFYQSKELTTKVSIKECNRFLAREFNHKLLSLLPLQDHRDGISIKVDDTNFRFGPKSELAKVVMRMDSQVNKFLMEQKTLCSQDRTTSLK